MPVKHVRFAQLLQELRHTMVTSWDGHYPVNARVLHSLAEQIESNRKAVEELRKEFEAHWPK
jgi:hypothetical protein